MTTSIEDLLQLLDRAGREHVTNPGPESAGDAAAVLRQLVRYAAQLGGAGFGEGAAGRQREQEASRVIAAGNRVVREVPAGQRGRAADLAAAAIDALAVSRPPMTADERWAVLGRLQQPMARAINALTAGTDSPGAVVAYSTLRTFGDYVDVDPPLQGSLRRLDDVIPKPAPAPTDLAPSEYGDQLSMLAALVRADLENGQLTVRDSMVLADTGLVVAHTARLAYVAAGLPALGGVARDCSQSWADLHHHLHRNVMDGMDRRADPAVSIAAAPLHRTILQLGMDPDLARRPDLAAQLAGLAEATGRLPELGIAISARADQWERTGGIRQREDPAHSSLEQGRYFSTGFANEFEPSNALEIRQLAGKAVDSSAALSVALEQHSERYPRPWVSAANRDVVRRQEGGRAEATRAAARPTRPLRLVDPPRRANPGPIIPAHDVPVPPGPDLGR